MAKKNKLSKKARREFDWAFKEGKRLIDEGAEHIRINGIAGTGKTFLEAKLMEYAWQKFHSWEDKNPETGKRTGNAVLLIAFTHQAKTVAERKVDSIFPNNKIAETSFSTMDSFLGRIPEDNGFGLVKRTDKKDFRMMPKTAVVFKDEYSMDDMDAVGKLQMLVSGDPDYEMPDSDYNGPVGLKKKIRQLVWCGDDRQLYPIGQDFISIDRAFEEDEVSVITLCVQKRTDNPVMTKLVVSLAGCVRSLGNPIPIIKSYKHHMDFVDVVKFFRKKPNTNDMLVVTHVNLRGESLNERVHKFVKGRARPEKGDRVRLCKSGIIARIKKVVPMTYKNIDKYIRKEDERYRSKYDRDGKSTMNENCKAMLDRLPERDAKRLYFMVFKDLDFTFSSARMDLYDKKLVVPVFLGMGSYPKLTTKPSSCLQKDVDKVDMEIIESDEFLIPECERNGLRELYESKKMDVRFHARRVLADAMKKYEFTPKGRYLRGKRGATLGRLFFLQQKVLNVDYTYCVGVYKTQGLTVKYAVVDWKGIHKANNQSKVRRDNRNRMVYVAASRASKRTYFLGNERIALPVQDPGVA